MRIRSTALSVLYKLCIVAAGAAGILIQLGVFEGRCNAAMFRYFTNLSNLLVIVYFSIDAAMLLRRRTPDAPETWCPALKGVATMGITVTWLVAHFLLGNEFTMGGMMRLAVDLVHYAVPVMTLCDYVLFDEKGRIPLRAPLEWTAFPLAYFAAAIAAVALGYRFTATGSRYPYPFMDIDRLGLPRVLLTVALLTAAFVALGYAFLLIDRGLKRLGDRIALRRAAS